MRCIPQAALAVAALHLDAQLQRDPTVSKMLVKVHPGSAASPVPPAYEEVCPDQMSSLSRDIAPGDVNTGCDI